MPAAAYSPRFRESDPWFVRIFGLYGDERHAGQFLGWLKTSGANGEDALAAIEDLLTAGCEMRTLIANLMEVRRSLYLKPISARDLRSARAHLSRAADSVRMLTHSTLTWDLALTESNLGIGPATGIEMQLVCWAMACKHAAPLASRKENRAFVMMTSRLIKTVRDGTGRHQDEQLNRILIALTEQPSFDVRSWRKRHKVRRPLRS